MEEKKTYRKKIITFSKDTKTAINKNISTKELKKKKSAQEKSVGAPYRCNSNKSMGGRCWCPTAETGMRHSPRMNRRHRLTDHWGEYSWYGI
jgi:hypothetical protein